MAIIKVPSPVQILFVDRLLKGDKGDPGTGGTGGESVEVHETLYEHGNLHAHSNKALLDSLSHTPDQGLMVNGVPNTVRAIYVNGVISSVALLTGDLSKVVTGLSSALTKPAIPPTAYPGSDWRLYIVVEGARLVGASADYVNGSSVSIDLIHGMKVFIKTYWEWYEASPPPDNSPG